LKLKTKGSSKFTSFSVFCKLPKSQVIVIHVKQDAMLSQTGGPRDAAETFDTYRILQQHRAVSLPQHGFLVGLSLSADCSELSVKK